MKKQAKQLISSAQSAQQQFGSFASDMEQRRATITQLCESFKSTAGQGKTNLSPEMKEFVGKITDSVEAVLTKVQKSIEGEEFIRLFDTSLIVLVVGKVNVGKSSLGNLVSGDVFNKALGLTVHFKESR